MSGPFFFCLCISCAAISHHFLCILWFHFGCWSHAVFSSHGACCSLHLTSTSQPCFSSPIWPFPLFFPHKNVLLGSLFFFRPPAQQIPAASSILHHALKTSLAEYLSVLFPQNLINIAFTSICSLQFPFHVSFLL